MNKPIGVFDSGVGGLTVVKELMRLLPGENIVYFRFGEEWRYAFNLFMVMFFAGCFLYLMFLCVRYTLHSANGGVIWKK